MKYEAIIFDMDGTITNTEPVWDKVMRAFLKQYNIAVPEKIYHEFKHQLRGVSLYDSCAVIKQMGNLKISIEEIFNQQRSLFKKLSRHNIEFLDGFLPFFTEVKKHKLKTGIATNATSKTVSVVAEVLPLEKLFGKHIYTISDVQNTGKPDPTLYLYTAEKLNTPPNRCIAIEDSPCGVEAAKNAGMFCIGLNSARIKEKLVMADIIVDTYAEINLPHLII